MECHVIPAFKHKKLLFRRRITMAEETIIAKQNINTSLNEQQKNEDSIY